MRKSNYCVACLCSACTKGKCPFSRNRCLYLDDCGGPMLDCCFFENRFKVIRYHVKRKRPVRVSTAQLVKLQAVLNEILGAAEAKPLTEFQRLKQEYKKCISKDGASLTAADKSEILDGETSGKEEEPTAPGLPDRGR